MPHHGAPQFKVLESWWQRFGPSLQGSSSIISPFRLRKLMLCNAGQNMKLNQKWRCSTCLLSSLVSGCVPSGLMGVSTPKLAKYQSGMALGTQLTQDSLHQ